MKMTIFLDPHTHSFCFMYLDYTEHLEKIQ